MPKNGHLVHLVSRVREIFLAEVLGKNIKTIGSQAYSILDSAYMPRHGGLIQSVSKCCGFVREVNADCVKLYSTFALPGGYQNSTGIGVGGRR